MYAFHLPEAVIKSITSRLWNLGDVYLTDGVYSAIQDEDFDPNKFLLLHLMGDYGILEHEPSDKRRNQCSREEGRMFLSLYPYRDEYLKVVTQPSLGRTVMCWQSED